MTTGRIVASAMALAIATTGLAVVGAEPSIGSVVASVTITNPEAGATVFGDVDVEAQAYGQSVDPPQKIQFFVDHHKRPAATADCLINLANMSSYCGAHWLWHTSALAGHHSLSAQVVLLDGMISERSEYVPVVVQGQTRLVVHHAKHVVAGHKLVVTGRIRSLGKGRPGARNLPVTVMTAPRYGKARMRNLRTNKRGVYRTSVPATTNTTVTVTPAGSRRYQQSTATTYLQLVGGHPRCRLSRTHARLKQPVALRCQLKHLPISSRFIVQNRIHGKWRRNRAFRTKQANRTEIAISGLQRRTLVVREVFPTSSNYARSNSNPVRLHVT